MPSSREIEKNGITYVFEEQERKKFADEQNFLSSQTYGVAASKRQCSDVDDICSICQAEFQKPILLICQVIIFLRNLNKALLLDLHQLQGKKNSTMLSRKQHSRHILVIYYCNQGLGRLAKSCPLCSNDFYAECMKWKNNSDSRLETKASGKQAIFNNQMLVFQNISICY